MRPAVRPAALLLAGVVCACQSPTDPDETIDVIQASASPNPASATGPTGRTYLVPRTNLPDEEREYDWTTSFTIAVTLTDDAASSSVDLTLPVKLSSASVSVAQSTGGVITTPTGSDTVHYEFDILSTSANQFTAVNTTLNITLQVWYDLPNLRREAQISVPLVFADDDGRSFSETVTVAVAP